MKPTMGDILKLTVGFASLGVVLFAPPGAKVLGLCLLALLLLEGE
jgi:hypothetical protein